MSFAAYWKKRHGDRKLAGTPMPELRRSRAKGGFLTHTRIKGEYKALCGYRPSSPTTTLMKDRHGWDWRKFGIRSCKKCEQKERDLRRKHLIDTGALKGVPLSTKD